MGAINLNKGVTMDIVDFYLEDLKSKFNKIDPDKYYLSYSGGKDSHLLYWFIKDYAKLDIEIVGCNTGMEFPEILQRIIKNSDKVLTPSLPITKVKEKYGTPCFSKEQDFYIYYYQNAIRKGKQPSKTIQQKIDGTYHTGFCISKKARDYVLNNGHNITHLCCNYLKKKPFEDYEKETGKKAILGVKGTESVLRKKQYTSCFSKNGKFTPLFDLTDELEDAIYKKYNIEIPEIYNHVERTGCIGCPYGSYKGDTIKELDYIKNTNEKQYNFIKDLFGESYKILGIKEE